MTIASSLASNGTENDPKTGTIYIQTGGQSLSRYDLTTNIQTNIGGSVPGNALGEGRDGFLYAGSGAALYRVNPNTGVSTLIGSGTNGYAGDIAVDPTDLSAMFGAVDTGTGVSLVRVDKSSGAQTLVGSFGLGGGASIFGLGFSLDGTLFAAGPIGGGGAIYTINKTTGAASQVRSLNFQPFDMATQPFETTEPGTVPEPATLCLLGVALAGLGFSRRRKLH